MDKKLSQPPKFNPMHHMPPPLNPRPTALPQHPMVHQLPGGPRLSPPRASALGSSGHHGGGFSSTSAFEMMYSALPSLTETARPSSVIPPPAATATAVSIPQLPLKSRRERLMKRHHTLTSETDTPSGSFEDTGAGSTSVPGSVPTSPSHLRVPDVNYTPVTQLELPPHRRVCLFVCFFAFSLLPFVRGETTHSGPVG